MVIHSVAPKDRLAYRDLLLLADEQWDLVKAYVFGGDMWVLEEDGEVGAECIVLDRGDGVVEVMNLAVRPELQRRGLGRRLVAHVQRVYAGRFQTLRICTGDSPLTVPFYESCGLHVVRRVKDYFASHYDHPIYEAGRLLTDLVVLEQDL